MSRLDRYADRRWSSWTYWLLGGALAELALRLAFYLLYGLGWCIFAGCRWAVRRARRARPLHSPA